MQNLIFLFLFLAAGPAFSSGFSTNGGTPSADQGNVWFLGEEPVEYCVESLRSENRSAAAAMVREAIDDWIAFFHKYELDQFSFGALAGKPGLKLALNFREVEKCTRPEHQIRFLFGVKTPEVERALETEVNAFGLALRRPYDHQTYRTGGQVYLRELHFTGSRLKHLILHELGHVFGMEHDSVFVMDERVVDLVRGLTNSYTELGKIESTTWPYRLQEKQRIDFSANGRKEGRYEPNFVIVFLRDLFGFPKDGFHSAGLDLSFEGGPAPSWLASFRFEGTTYPAVLEQRKGLILRIYVPQVDMWWSTENYVSSYYSR